jgi:hypothetical protein
MLPNTVYTQETIWKEISLKQEIKKITIAQEIEKVSLSQEIAFRKEIAFS